VDEQQKQSAAIGEQLYPLVHAMLPNIAKHLAGKLTGMLLDIDNTQLRAYLNERAQPKLAAAALLCIEALLSPPPSSGAAGLDYESAALQGAAAALASIAGKDNGAFGFMFTCQKRRHGTAHLDHLPMRSLYVVCWNSPRRLAAVLRYFNAPPVHACPALSSRGVQKPS
jgi:hypothetical protein